MVFKKTRQRIKDAYNQVGQAIEFYIAVRRMNKMFKEGVDMNGASDDMRQMQQSETNDKDKTS